MSHLSRVRDAEQQVTGIYGRLSLARMKDIMGRSYRDTTKVDEQERICRQIALTRKWPVAEGIGYPEPNGAFIDNNRSAWQRNRKRPGWDRMLEAVEAGRLTHLVIYHGDRLCRQPWDLEQLINLADQRGMIIASATGDFRLDVPTDRFVLRILTAKACLESDDTSRRKIDGFARMAQAGIAPAAGGRYGRGFGYDSTGREQVEAEADAIREAARRVLNGEGLGAIAAALNARGIRSVSGKPLNWHTLQRILQRPRIAGLLSTGERGNWEPILDPGEWEMTRATLTDRARVLPKEGNRHYLLSGIARCSECGGGMQRHSTGRAGHLTVGYGCVTPGCRKVHRNLELLDAYVITRVVARLNHPGNPPGRIPEAPGLASEFASLTEALAEVDEVLADHTRGQVPALLARRDGIKKRLAELRELAGDDARARLLTKHAGISREEFMAEPLSVQRSLVGACFEVVVLPASARGPGFRTEDVRLKPR